MENLVCLDRKKGLQNQTKIVLLIQHSHSKEEIFLQHYKLFLLKLIHVSFLKTDCSNQKNP